MNKFSMMMAALVMSLTFATTASASPWKQGYEIDCDSDGTVEKTVSVQCEYEGEMVSVVAVCPTGTVTAVEVCQNPELRLKSVDAANVRVALMGWTLADATQFMGGGKFDLVVETDYLRFKLGGGIGGVEDGGAWIVDLGLFWRATSWFSLGAELDAYADAADLRRTEYAFVGASPAVQFTVWDRLLFEISMPMGQRFYPGGKSSGFTFAGTISAGVLLF